MVPSCMRSTGTSQASRLSGMCERVGWGTGNGRTRVFFNGADRLVNLTRAGLMAAGHNTGEKAFLASLE